MHTQPLDLRIEASHEALSDLKRALYDAVSDVDLQEDAELKMGQHGEPILIALVVALGGATLTRQILMTIRHWLDTRIKQQQLDVIKMYLAGPHGTRDVTLEELMKTAGALPSQESNADAATA